MVKKFLAVLLAVIVAVSAMSINVISVGFNALEDDTSGDTADSETQKYYTQVQVSFEFPLYTQLTQGSTLQLTLPRYFGNSIPEYSDSYEYSESNGVTYIVKSPLSYVDWSISVNGKAYALEEQILFHDPWWGNPHDTAYTDRVANGVNYGKSVSQHTITVGAFGHDWNAMTNDTEIPLSSDESTTIRLVADITLDGVATDWMVQIADFAFDPYSSYTTGRLAYDCMADFYDSEGNLVGTSFINDWNITKTVEEDPAFPKCTHPITHKEWTDSYHWDVCDYCGLPMSISNHLILDGKCFSCGYDESASSEPGAPKCDHAQSVTASDAHVHWYICDTCGEKWGIEDHTFEDGICTACGFEEILKYDFNGDGQLTLQDAIDTLKKVMHVE